MSSNSESRNRINVQQKIKYGSLQVFKKNDGIIEDLGWSKIQDEDIHRIGILDIRILNKDRNSENILFYLDREQKVNKLIPIDHGYCFPSDLYIHEDWMLWMSYPHSKRPFSEQLVQMIQSIDPKKNCQELQRQIPLRPECLLNYRIAETFLKIAIKKGKTLYEIGKIYLIEEEEDEYDSGDEEQHQSQLIKIVKMAELYYRTIKGKPKHNHLVQKAEDIQKTINNNEIAQKLPKEKDIIKKLQQEGLNSIEEDAQEQMEIEEVQSKSLPQSHLFEKKKKSQFKQTPKFPFTKSPSAPELREIQILDNKLSKRRQINYNQEEERSKINKSNNKNEESQLKLRKQLSTQYSQQHTNGKDNEAKNSINWDDDEFFKCLEDQLNLYFATQGNTAQEQPPQNIRRTRYMSTDETFD